MSHWTIFHAPVPFPGPPAPPHQRATLWDTVDTVILFGEHSTSSVSQVATLDPRQVSGSPQMQAPGHCCHPPLILSTGGKLGKSASHLGISCLHSSA